MTIKKVCVYCASSSKISKEHYNAADSLGKEFALHGITVIYGGGSVGSMGALANAVIQNNGNIIGVIPKFMMELEWGNKNITEMIVVETISERKKKLIESVDAVVALPGGTGTLEELAEIISMKKLGLFSNPIIILNTNGFYSHFLLFIEQMISDNFIRPEHKNLFEVANSPEEIIEKIKNAPTWGPELAILAAF
jgi:hypothetical protein